MPEPLALSVAEAAELIGISERGIYRQIRENRFPVPVVRFGTAIRIPVQALLEYLGSAA